MRRGATARKVKRGDREWREEGRKVVGKIGFDMGFRIMRCWD
jgi:hypothetical protein